MKKLIAVLAVLALAAAACGDDADDTTAAPATTAAAPTTTLDEGRDDVGEGSADGGVVITEVVFGSHVTVTNTGSAAADVSGLWLCNRPNYVQLGASTLGPGESVQVDAGNLGGLPADGGEAALYNDASFGDSAAIVDYVAWGGGGGRAGVAEGAGIWPAGATVDAGGASSISAPAGGSGPGDWS